VIGSAAEDFALAVALDRMNGAATWIPFEWMQDPHMQWPVQEGYRDLVHASRYSPRSSARSPVVTSISL
jgi:hypothetical protein